MCICAKRNPKMRPKNGSTIKYPTLFRLIQLFVTFQIFSCNDFSILGVIGEAVEKVFRLLPKHTRCISKFSKTMFCGFENKNTGAAITRIDKLRSIHVMLCKYRTSALWQSFRLYKEREWNRTRSSG